MEDFSGTCINNYLYMPVLWKHNNDGILLTKTNAEFFSCLLSLFVVSHLHLLHFSLDKSLCVVAKLQMQIVSLNCSRSRWYLLNFSHIPTVSGLSLLFSPFLCFQIIHIYLSANGQQNKIAIVFVVINNLHASFCGNFIFSLRQC